MYIQDIQGKSITPDFHSITLNARTGQNKDEKANSFNCINRHICHGKAITYHNIENILFEKKEKEFERLQKKKKDAIVQF